MAIDTENKNENGGNTIKQIEKKPNVLIIMTDQHRWDMMTCAGREDVLTPNIDRIAKRGIRFTNAFCPYPVCLASRSSFLSGLYAHNTGAIDNEDRLDWRYRTIAHHFSDNGYLTGLIGKMHFNDAHKHGFEYYMSINDWLMYLGPKAHLYADEVANHPLTDTFFNNMKDTGAGFPDVDDLWDGPSPWVGNVQRFDFGNVASKLAAEDHLDMFIARETVKVIKDNKDQPFFLVASFMKPHTPLYPPEEYADKYPISETDIPPIGDTGQYPEYLQNRIESMRKIDRKHLCAHRAGYRGNLAFVDTCIGMVYNSLEEFGLIDNTIVVYTSDHGEMDGDHGLYQKFCMFDPSVKVPLIVSYPGHLLENRVTEALTEYIGLYPTLAELTGTQLDSRVTLVDMEDAPEGMDAKSFVGILYNPDTEGPDATFAEYDLRSKTSHYMVRTKKYKYVYNPGSTNELYDLVEDPMETRNLIHCDGLKSVIDELHERLLLWYNPDKNPYCPK